MNIKTILESLSHAYKKVDVYDLETEYNHDKDDIEYSFFVQIPYQEIEAPDGEDTIVRISLTDNNIFKRLIYTSDILFGVDHEDQKYNLYDSVKNNISEYLENTSDFWKQLNFQINKTIEKENNHVR